MATISSILGVSARPTVVRLEESARAEWVSESYFVTDEAGLHLEALRRALARPGGTGAFVIGPYGSGKSHFLAYLTQQVRAGSLCDEPPEVITLSLLNYPSRARLEEIVSRALGIEDDETDRRPRWDEAMARHPAGVLLVLDELSEFLRSKPEGPAFTEDVRFLQFMGELAQGARLFVVAAMQEAIERTGVLDRELYRKIKDRFPLRLLLSPAHVRDLVANHVLEKKPGYEEAVDALAGRLAEALPGAAIDFETLRAIYPVHPATLEILEEVRDRFSQTRGVVDFVTRQLGGDETRGIEPFLDREVGAFLSPDRIVAHFEDIFEVQAEFVPLAQKLLPWYRKHLDELFETAKLRDLGERVLRLLVLAYLSPSRDGLTAGEAASWLLFAATRLDPKRNTAIVDKVLSRLASDGRFVKAEAGRFSIDLADDGAARLDQLLAKELSSLPSDEGVLLDELAESLRRARRGSSTTSFDPFTLPRGRWVSRTVSWHFHERPFQLFVGGEEPPRPTSELAVVLRLPWGRKDAAPGCATVTPAAVEADEQLRELAAAVRLRAKPTSPDVTDVLDRRIADRAPALLRKIRQAYSECTVVGPSGRVDEAPRLGVSQGLDEWLEELALASLKRLYPAFERSAPLHGPLPEEAYRELMRFVESRELGEPDDGQWTSLVREAYLVPMGLLQRRGRRYGTPARLDGNDLVKLVLQLLPHEPSPQVVHEQLAGPIYGLVPDQARVLLVFLLVMGEVDILKGAKSYRELYEAHPDPLRYDRIAAARGLSADSLRALSTILEALGTRPPSEWTVHAQRRAVGTVRESLRARALRLAPLALKLEGQELGRKVETFVGWSELLASEGERGSLAAFERLLEDAGSATLVASRIAELEGLPSLLERQMADLERFRYLLEQPGFKERAAELGGPPDLGEPAEVDRWLGRIRSIHESYKQDYRKEHDSYWQTVASDPIWSYSPPPAARSRLADLGDLLASLERATDRAERQRCRRLPNLDFQARCGCGFDGESAFVAETLAEHERLRQSLEKRLAELFADDAVRKRVAAWAEEEGGRSREEARSYLDGAEPWPKVSSLNSLDDSLASVEAVRRLSTDVVTRLLVEKTWRPSELTRAFAELVESFGAERLRFEAGEPEGAPEEPSGPPDEGSDECG